MRTNKGILGATRSSWDEGPKRIVAEVHDAHPQRVGENKDAWFARLLPFFMRATAHAGKDYVAAVHDYFLTNMLNSLRGERSISNSRADMPPRAASLSLLDLDMPNGKPLKDCTGADCRRFGGWFAALSARVGVAQTVGSVMKERELKAMYRKAASK